jgi:hypothetical protein
MVLSVELRNQPTNEIDYVVSSAGTHVWWMAYILQ